MSREIARVAARIHRRGVGLVLALCGGTRALSDLLEIPGASRVVFESTTPYSEAAMREFVGTEVSGAVSAENAELMALAAYRRACRFAASSQRVAGIACTAALRTDRPKRGEHRCYLVTWDGERLRRRHLVLSKEQRSREEEEEIVRRLILETVAATVDRPVDLVFPLLLPGERIRRSDRAAPDPLRQLLAGEIDQVCVSPEGTLSRRRPPAGALFPGSFHPLHDGHRQIVAVAGACLRRPVHFELSVENVDKPSLPLDELSRRIEQFRNTGSWLVLTRRPTFLSKAELLPRRPFVVGHDTARRVLSPDYYGGSVRRRDRALRQLKELGSRFLVAGRKERRSFRTVEDLDIPESFRNLFHGIPESAFRNDISSTELRRKRRSR